MRTETHATIRDCLMLQCQMCSLFQDSEFNHDRHRCQVRLLLRLLSLWAGHPQTPIPSACLGLEYNYQLQLQLHDLNLNRPLLPLLSRYRNLCRGLHQALLLHAQPPGPDLDLSP